MPITSCVFAMPSEVMSESKPVKELDFNLDDDISLSPTSGMVSDAKTPAAILAGAAHEVAKSTRAPEPVAKSLPAQDESFTIPGRGVSFEPESIPRFDLDFNLEEASRPGPTMTPIPPLPPTPKPSAPKELAEPALATQT